MENKYPEHEKLKLISDKSQELGFFIEWMQRDKGYFLCKDITHPGSMRILYERIRRPISDIVAEFYNIDQKILEQEKRQMLDAIRQSNSKTQ